MRYRRADVKGGTYFIQRRVTGTSWLTISNLIMGGEWNLVGVNGLISTNGLS